MQPKQEIAAAIIAMERAALDRSDRGDPEGFLEISDPQVTYFDPSLEQPIRGLDALSDYYRRSFTVDDEYHGQILNPGVQVTGDIAVLTFNYVVTGRTTGRVTRWNTTEVYRRTGDTWRIIHTHWAFTQPKLAQ